MSKVLIADDHAVFRAGLRQFLGEVPGVSEIGEAVSGNDTLDRLRENEWDLPVLDLNMPDRGRHPVHVRAGHAGTALVLSGYPERQHMNVLRAKNGYIAKDSSPEELMKAIRIAAGATLRQ
jgi:DNA-binding NarL/FixJ family response regulator